MRSGFLKFVLTMFLSASSAQALEYTQVADGFDVPWSLGFLPDGSLLVTERAGQLWHVSPHGQKSEIKNLPSILADGQGGLLDVVVARDFDQSRTIFLSYTQKRPGGVGTVLSSAQLSLGNHLLKDHQTLFEMARGSDTGRHFGGRIVESREGHLFLTLGDLGQRLDAQRLDLHSGKVVRVARDGSVPQRNPFKGRRQSQPKIWSLGHRNPQGAALDAEGNLWVSEHGPKGGDEINRVEKGANYGWPIIGYGQHYSGEQVGDGTHMRGMEQPEFYWDPSIAPSGLMHYQGEMFPHWQGDWFVGSLKFDYIARLSGTPLREVERIQSPHTGRVRDVRQSKDGAIWFLSEDNGALYRITP